MYRQFIQSQDIGAEVVWPVSLYHVQARDMSQGGAKATVFGSDRSSRNANLRSFVWSLYETLYLLAQIHFKNT